MGRASTRVALCLAVVAAVSGCRLGDRSIAPSHAAAYAPAWPAEVLAAERALRDLRPGDAEHTLRAAGGIDGRAPERSWLLIDLLVTRAAVTEARASVDALPESPMADVLRAHARVGPGDERLRRVRRAYGTSAAGWARLEIARALVEEGGRRESAIAEARHAAAIGSPYVAREAWLLVAGQMLEANRASAAAEATAAATAIDPADPRGPALGSRAAARLGRADEAALLALDAIRLAPKSPRTARRAADLVREGVSRTLALRMREGIAPLLHASPSAELLACSGALEEQTGRASVAIERYGKALSLGADPVPVDRRLRRLLLAHGRRREATALLLRAAPPDARTDPKSLVRDAWARLEATASRVADGPLRPADEPALVEFATSLSAVGAVEDAVAALSSAATPAALATRARLAREVDFERAMRIAVEEGYRAPSRGDAPPTLESLLARLDEVARSTLPPDEAQAFAVSGRGVRRVPLLGAWLDHSADTTSPVVAHFRRFGKYLILGAREGKPAEAILLSLASLTRQRELTTQGRTFHHDVAVGYDREIRAYLDFQGGALAGAALPDGVWLDADAARRDDHALRSTLRVADPVLLARLERVRVDAPECDGPDGPLALDDPAGLVLRLARRYALRVGDAPWGSLDMLRAHEFGHVLDLARHLPVAKGLPATASLLASQGFALEKVEARLEGRAQLGAAMDALHPDLALIDLVRALPLVERTPEVHERGYRDVTAAIVSHIARHADRYRAIDVHRKILPQLDRLSPEEIRAVAWAVAAEGWRSAP